jgi:DNA-directed RNA polymerase specialized sigma24 family protein
MNSGDREQWWHNLIEKWTPQMRRYLAAVPCSSGEREEIIWDVWASAADHETGLLDTPRQWLILRTLLRAECAARVRTWSREYLDERVSDLAVELEVPPPDPVSMDVLLRALDTLPRVERLAVDFRHRWGWSYRLVAGAMGISEGAARVAVSRGLGRLRQLLASYVEGGRPSNDASDLHPPSR